MKINWFLAAIAFAMAGLAAYGFFSAHYESEYRLVVTALAFVSFFAPISGLLALKVEGHGGSVNIRLLSALFVIAAFIDNIFFTIKIKAWQLALVKKAFGEIIDLSGIERMLSVVPAEVVADFGTFSLTPYIIITGMLTLIYLCLAYAVIKALR